MGIICEVGNCTRTNIVVGMTQMRESNTICVPQAAVAISNISTVELLAIGIETHTW